MTEPLLPHRRLAASSARAGFGHRSARPSPGRPGAALALAGLLAACGGKAVFDGTPAGEGGAGAGGTTSTTSTTGTTSTTTGIGGQGGGPLTISLSNVVVGINCMPEVPADPVYVSFTATYDDASPASVSASIVGATVSLGGPPSTLDWSFQVSPATVGPVPGNSSVQVDHVKVDGSGSGGGSPCNFCSSPSALLEVDYVIDGQYSVVATGSGPVGCGL
jgi:hypothetical protein